jgi:hypothetical protein
MMPPPFEFADFPAHLNQSAPSVDSLLFQSRELVLDGLLREAQRLKFVSDFRACHLAASVPGAEAP